MSKNTGSVKSTKTESPKTPGGISISLLTPCRRVGLSRSWRKKGPSPFVSPLSNSQRNTDDEQSTPKEKNPRKRKKESPEKDSQDIQEQNDTGASATHLAENENSQTPTRTNLARKKSKTLSKVIHESKTFESPTGSLEDTEQNDTIIDASKNTKLSKLSRHNSKSKNTNSPQIQAIDKENIKDVTSTPNQSDKVQQKEEKEKSISPQNLAAECVVVIQKEIFNKTIVPTEVKKSKDPKPSQVLFDSDSDDVPLCQMNKTTKDTVDKVITSNKVEVNNKSIERTDTNNSDVKINNMKEENKTSKLENKKTSTTDLKSVMKKSKLSRKNSKTDKIIKLESKPSSQSSFDDDDDDDFDHRKTILVRKSYDKVAKPSRAKSTGSITDKDIEELKNRIEVKKKLLLAKSLDSDTQDLRDLIKKWQRGCQDALVELMELMKKKMPEQPRMENAQILEMLKIPADLVGYDSENDCFNSPNDTNIILSSLKM